MHTRVNGILLDSNIFSVRFEHLCEAVSARSYVAYHYRVTFYSENEDAGTVGPDDRLVLQIFQRPKLSSQVGPEQTTEKYKNGTQHVVSAHRVEVNDETVEIEWNGNMWIFNRNFDGMNDSGSTIWPATTWRLPNFNLSNIYGNRADAHNDALCDSYDNSTIRNLTSLTFWCREFSYCTFYLIISDGKVDRSDDNIPNCAPNSCPQFASTMPTIDDIFLQTQIGVCTYDARDQCTGDSNTFYEIEPTTSIGGCVAATTTTTTTERHKHLTEYWGGG
jgi:hypothetical protein